MQKYGSKYGGEYTWPHPFHGIAPHNIHKVLSRHAFDCFQMHTISILTEIESSRWNARQEDDRIRAWLEELYGNGVTDPSGLRTIEPEEQEDDFSLWYDERSGGSRLSMTYISSSDLEGGVDIFGP